MMPGVPGTRVRWTVTVAINGLHSDGEDHAHSDASDADAQSDADSDAQLDADSDVRADASDASNANDAQPDAASDADANADAQPDADACTHRVHLTRRSVGESGRCSPRVPVNESRSAPLA